MNYLKMYSKSEEMVIDFGKSLLKYGIIVHITTKVSFINIFILN